jgi:hypothetical protein
MRKKIIVVKTFKIKGPKKMIWLFFVPFSFLEVVPSDTTQGYFHPSQSSCKHHGDPREYA